jgi:asparagine N-glycosylation enzyme membrane subunit Stt3
MRWTGVGAAIIAAADDALYLGVINTQGGSNPQFLRAPFVAAFIAVMAVCAALSSRASAARLRPLLLGASAAGLLLLGFFGIFSIGLPLMVAGVLAGLGLIGSLAQAKPSAETAGKAAVAIAVGGGVLAIVALLVGLSITELAIRCPANGIEEVSGTSFLGGSYQARCDNGKLSISR